MAKYIGIAPDKEVFNIKGESLGMQGERVLYYASDVGRHRIYRSSYPLKPYMFNGVDINKTLKLLYFNTFDEAKEVVDEINRVYGDDFVVKEVKQND